MPLHVVHHPLIRHKLGMLRRKELAVSTFRDVAREITYLLAYEAFRDLDLEPVTIEGWAGVLDVAFPVESPRSLRMVLAGSPPANPVELLGSQQMGTLIQELRGVCDLVVIDTPPALNFADACELGSFIDGFLLVVRSGKTPRDALARTHRQLAGYRILGAILNDIRPPRRLGYGYRYYGGDALRAPLFDLQPRRVEDVEARQGQDAPKSCA